DGFRETALAQIDAAIAQARCGGPHDDAAHQIRKHCKKLRGLVRLVRSSFPDYRKENTAFRDAARLLSGVRNAQSMLETCEKLEEKCGDRLDPRGMAGIRSALRRQQALAQEAAGTQDEQIQE